MTNFQIFFSGTKIRKEFEMTRTAAAALVHSLKGQILGKGKSPTLESLIDECERTTSTWGLRQNDIAFTLAFWSMVDCGFECVSSKKTLPKDWKHETRQIYEAEFFLPPYSDCPVKLVALPADDILCINVLASEVSSKNVNLKSLAIHSPGYIPRPDEEGVSCKFSGLSDFQLLLRNVIIWPIRCSILTDQGVMNGSLCGVSDEMKLKIISHLPVNDVLMLSETCHDLNRICNDQGLWKTLFHNRYRYLCECVEGNKQCNETKDWKESFKEAYSRRKAERSFQDSPTESYHTAPEGPYGSEIDFDVD